MCHVDRCRSQVKVPRHLPRDAPFDPTAEKMGGSEAPSAAIFLGMAGAGLSWSSERRKVVWEATLPVTFNHPRWCSLTRPVSLLIQPCARTVAEAFQAVS